MELLIPMAGLGSRFNNTFGDMPKPLIDINGEPMFVKAVKSLQLDANISFVIRESHYSDVLRGLINDFFPNANLLEIDYLPKGPAASALLMAKMLESDAQLVIANCDQIMDWSSDDFIKKCSRTEFDAILVTYTSDTPKNSYCRVDKNNFVLEVKEKEVISNVSTNGIHYWDKVSYFIESSTEHMSDKSNEVNSEFFIAPTYNNLIAQGYTVGIHHIARDNHFAVGTPEDLNRYLKLSS